MKLKGGNFLMMHIRIEMPNDENVYRYLSTPIEKRRN
jgi:hypothetical protein